MKRIHYPLLLSLFLLFAVQLSGQDKIVMISGEVLHGKVEEVGLDEIRYKKQDNLSGPVYVLAKKDVHSIHYENGSKDEFAVEKKTEDDYVKENGKKGDNDDVYGGDAPGKPDGNKKRKNKHRDHDMDVVVPVWHVLGWVILADIVLGCF